MPDSKVVDLRLIQQSQEPVICVEAGEAREDSDGRLIWVEGNYHILTRDGLDPRRFDAQIVVRHIDIAANWAAGLETKKGAKLAKKLRKLLKKLES
jgi:ribosomal protein S16